jgi:hypothetical protein
MGQCWRLGRKVGCRDEWGSRLGWLVGEAGFWPIAALGI